MKNLCKFVCALGLVLSSFAFGQTKLQEPEYNKDVTISNYDFPTSNKIGAGFSFDLGRASRDCQGFGLCRLVAIWVFYDPFHKVGNQENIKIQKDDNGMFVAFQLNNKLDSSKFDTTFYVDETLTISNKDHFYTIEKGVYPLDQHIGGFGGYKIPVK